VGHKRHVLLERVQLSWIESNSASRLRLQKTFDESCGNRQKRFRAEPLDPRPWPPWRCRVEIL